LEKELITQQEKNTQSSKTLMAMKLDLKVKSFENWMFVIIFAMQPKK